MADGGHTQRERRRSRFATAPLRCVECGSSSGRAAPRWRGYRIDVPTEDEVPALAFYCPVCAEREFGALGPGQSRTLP